MRNLNLLTRNDNSAPKDELIGRTIGNYRISEEIGRGGMGVVYKAVHQTLEKVVAVKAFSSKSSSKMSIDGLEPVIRFYKEAQTQARLDHPNIISVQDFLKFGDNYFIIMEYVHGESLGKILSRHGAFEPNIAISIFKQILDGIRYAHSKGVIHRDIKPSNFILTPNYVKITDFGVSQLTGDAKLTTTGAVIGTPKYMSPEQILGNNTDHRSDIDSLGITFYEMLTGSVPFNSDNDSDFEIKRGHVELPPPPLSLIKPGI
ncbi:MAG: serine/threonine-protein kinase, partial [Thermodesulfobacteriota bacterium]